MVMVPRLDTAQKSAYHVGGRFALPAQDALEFQTDPLPAFQFGVDAHQLHQRTIQ